MKIYDAMEDRDIDIAVAKKVMGRDVEGTGWSAREVESETYFERFGSGSHQRIWQRLPRYSSEDSAARLVRERIAALGISQEFIMNLEGAAKLLRAKDWDIAHFLYMQTSARDQAIAALRAIDDVAEYPKTARAVLSNASPEATPAASRLTSEAASAENVPASPRGTE